MSAQLSTRVVSGLDPDVLERIRRPTASASGLPNEAYASPESLVHERERLFGTTWSCIGQACQVPEPGDARPISFLGVPLLMLRDAADQVRVFHNVCSHRGNELVWAPCRLPGRIRCPYHAWTYDFEGNLRGTPHVGGPGNHEVDGFAREPNGLRTVRAAVWLDLVFVDLGATAPPFEQHVAPLAERLFGFADESEYARLRPAATHGTLELDVAANWKLCIENNLDAYHLPWVHPDLNKDSPLEDHYSFFGDDLFAGQGSRSFDRDRTSNVAFPQLTGWPERTSEYPTMFPNVFIGVHRDHMWSMVIEPIAHDRTRERLQIYYVEEGADGALYEPGRAAQLEAWTKVFREDLGVVEGMQRGRGSPAFTGGVFSPVMDPPTHGFHRWVAGKLAAG